MTQKKQNNLTFMIKLRYLLILERSLRDVSEKILQYILHGYLKSDSGDTVMSTEA